MNCSVRAERARLRTARIGSLAVGLNCVRAGAISRDFAWLAALLASRPTSAS